WNEGSYRACEAGRRQPSRKMAISYAKALDVDLTWLLSGMGAPTSDPSRPEVQQVPIYRLQEFHAAKKALRMTTSPGAESSSLIPAMLAAAVAQGVAVFPAEEKLPPNVFVLVMADDAMHGPTTSPKALFPGDKVWFDPDLKPQPEDIVLARF